MPADEAKTDETRLARAGSYSWRLALTTAATLPGAIVPGLVGAGPVATLIGTIVAGLVGAFFAAEGPTTRTKAVVGLALTALAVVLTVSGFTLADFLRGRSVVGDTRYTFPVAAGAGDRVDAPAPEPSPTRSASASAAPRETSGPARAIAPTKSPAKAGEPGVTTASSPSGPASPTAMAGPVPGPAPSPAAGPSPSPSPVPVYSYGLEIDGISVNHLRLVGAITVGPSPGSVTLARAVPGDTAFEDLMRSPQRRVMALANFDATGNPIRRYRIEGALPTSLESGATEEMLTLAYESVSIE